MESTEGGQDKDSEALSEALSHRLVVSKQYGGPDRGPDGLPSEVHGDMEQEEDFFDCEETLGCGKETAGGPSAELRHTGEEDEERGDPGSDRKAWEKGREEQGPGAPEEITERGGGAGRPQEEEGFADYGEEDGGASAEVDKEEFELKGQQVAEFDEEYLSELEKDLSHEEKESRRAESLELKEAGNGQFKRGEHCDAESSYTAALRVCPLCYGTDRAVLFSNRAAARLHLGKNEDAIADCSKAIELNPDYVRAILRRAELYEKTDKLDEALEDYKLVLEKDPSVKQAREASMRLPQQIQERNERLKEEMMGKLKDLGNMILRPFGLSTSNFQVNQDPTSGSYSINFVQNPNNNNR